MQTLYGFLRLRIPSGTSLVLPDLRGCALIRELHVYGKLKKVRDAFGVHTSRQVFFLFWETAAVPTPSPRESSGRFRRLCIRRWRCRFGWSMSCVKQTCAVCRVLRRE